MMKLNFLKMKNKAQQTLCFVLIDIISFNIKKCTIIVFCLISFLSNSHEIDSLLKEIPQTNSEKSKIELWEKIINISIWQTSDKVRKDYIDSLYNYSQTKSSEYGDAVANLLYSKHFERQQDLGKARKHAALAYNIFEKQENKLGLCKTLRQQGFNALKTGNVELATELAYKALDISIEIDNSFQEALCLGQIGILSYETQKEEAIKIEKKSLNMLMDLEAYREASSTIINLSTFYLNMYKDEESLIYLDTLFQLQKNLNDIVILAHGNLGRAVAYNAMGEFSLADEALRKSEYYFMSVDNPSKQAEFYRMKGVFYKERESFNKAIEASEKGLSLIEDLEGLEMEKGWLNDNLYHSYKSLKKYKEALQAFEKSTEYKSKLYDERTQQVVSELKEKYEAEQKEQELELIKKKERVTALELEEQKTKNRERTYLIITLGVFLIAVIIWMYFRRKQKVLKVEKHAAQLEHKVLRAQMNPHFIFNALNSIQRIYVEGNIKKANDYMADFAQLMRKILESSGSNKISLAEEIETLRLYMDLEKLRCKDCFTYQIDIGESISLGMKIAPLLLQPFVENSIWHGVLPLENKEGQINIKITDLDEDAIQVEIKDNGVGFDPKDLMDNKSSRGIAITKQRIEGEVMIDSTPHIGTTVSFKIKKKDD